MAETWEESGRKSLIQHIFQVLNGRIWSQLQRTNLSEASFQLQVQAQQFLAFCFFASVVFLRVLRFPRSSQLNLNQGEAEVNFNSAERKDVVFPRDNSGFHQN